MKTTKKMSRAEAFELLQQAKTALLRVSEGLELLPRGGRNLAQAYDLVTALAREAEPTKLPEGAPGPVAVLFHLLKGRSYEVEARRSIGEGNHWLLTINGAVLAAWREDGVWLQDGLNGHLRYASEEDLFHTLLSRLSGHPLPVVRLAEALRNGWDFQPSVEQAEGLFLVSVSFGSVSRGVMFDPDRKCWTVQRPIKPFLDELPAESADVVSRWLYAQLTSSVESLLRKGVPSLRWRARSTAVTGSANDSGISVVVENTPDNELQVIMHGKETNHPTFEQAIAEIKQMFPQSDGVGASTASA